MMKQKGTKQNRFIDIVASAPQQKITKVKVLITEVSITLHCVS